MSFDQALIAARYRRDDEDALSDLAQAALAEGQEELALPVLHGAAQRLDSALLWQWTGLLHRALDEHEAALAAFAEAAALAPMDKSIAHGRARVALESGLPAEILFQRALQLSPSDGDVLLGYAAALFADGRLGDAEATLDNALARSPLWTEGHMKLAQLRSRMGNKDRRRRRWSARSSNILARSSSGSPCFGCMSKRSSLTRSTRPWLGHGPICGQPIRC